MRDVADRSVNEFDESAARDVALIAMAEGVGGFD